MQVQLTNKSNFYQYIDSDVLNQLTTNNMKKLFIIISILFLSFSAFSQYNETMDLSVSSGLIKDFKRDSTFSVSRGIMLLKPSVVTMYDGFDDVDTEPEVSRLNYTIVHTYSIVVNKVVFWTGRTPFRKVKLPEGVYTITHSITVKLKSTCPSLKSFEIFNTSTAGMLCEYEEAL